MINQYKGNITLTIFNDSNVTFRIPGPNCSGEYTGPTNFSTRKVIWQGSPPASISNSSLGQLISDTSNNRIRTNTIVQIDGKHFYDFGTFPSTQITLNNATGSRLSKIFNATKTSDIIQAIGTYDITSTIDNYNPVSYCLAVYNSPHPDSTSDFRNYGPNPYTVKIILEVTLDTEITGEPSRRTPATPVTRPKKNNNNKRNVIVGLAIGGVLLLFIVIILIIALK
jgi:hypothetical protein